MNRKIMLLFIVSIFLVSSLNSNLVSSKGASGPTLIPPDLLRGEVGKFVFHVSNMGSTADISCDFTVEGLDPLIVSFEKTSEMIKAEEEKRFEGNIRVPMNAEIKTYSGTLKATCSPSLEGERGSTLKEIYPLTFSVNIVAEKLTTTTIPQEKPETTVMSPLVIIIIIIIAAVIIYYWTKKKK